jgi:hypothetical protein
MLFASISANNVLESGNKINHVEAFFAFNFNYAVYVSAEIKEPLEKFKKLNFQVNLNKKIRPYVF